MNMFQLLKYGRSLCAVLASSTGVPFRFICLSLPGKHLFILGTSYCGFLLSRLFYLLLLFVIYCCNILLILAIFLKMKVVSKVTKEFFPAVNENCSWWHITNALMQHPNLGKRDRVCLLLCLSYKSPYDNREQPCRVAFVVSDSHSASW